jgi:hypothetical protein
VTVSIGAFAWAATAIVAIGVLIVPGGVGAITSRFGRIRG